MDVAVVGASRIGLVAAAGLADLGVRVHCVDTEPARIAMLERGTCDVGEPDVLERLSAQRQTGRLLLTTNLHATIRRCAVVFVMVDTDERAPGVAELAPLDDVMKAIGWTARRHTVAVIGRAVPVGTGARVTSEMMVRASVPIDVVSNPLCVRRGSAIADFRRPRRILIGGGSPRAQRLLRSIYRPLVDTGAVVTTADHTTVELIVQAANALRSLHASFLNELAGLCDATGGDLNTVAQGLDLRDRRALETTRPGLGFGDVCEPQGVRMLTEASRRVCCRLGTVEGAIETNRAVVAYLVERLRQSLGGVLAGQAIGVLARGWPASLDEEKESPWLAFARRLVDEGASVRVCLAAPVRQEARRAEPTMTLCDNAATVVDGGDALAVLTNGSEFKSLDLAALRRTMRRGVLLDALNLYDPDWAAAAGFDYIGRGRRRAADTPVAPDVPTPSSGAAEAATAA